MLWHTLRSCWRSLSKGRSLACVGGWVWGVRMGGSEGSRCVRVPPPVRRVVCVGGGYDCPGWSVKIEEGILECHSIQVSDASASAPRATCSGQDSTPSRRGRASGAVAFHAYSRISVLAGWLRMTAVGMCR
jgi:hypothetical protein